MIAGFSQISRQIPSNQAWTDGSMRPVQAAAFIHYQQTDKLNNTLATFCLPPSLL
jgi:hypothetical protein